MDSLTNFNKIMKSKFCISSTASFNQINKAPTNHSITKQTFSFSRGQRFEAPKPTCPLNTYGGDFLSKKGEGAAIGYGKKSDFTRCLTVSPSSSKYNLKSFWDENATKRRGASFGLSRDKVSFNNYIPKQLIAVPSSTQYNSQKPNKFNSPKYSLREKTKMVDKTRTIQPQNKNPGPGSYINPQLQSESSSKHISKFQKISYGQARSPRFASSNTIAPGPGKYADVNNLSKDGHYKLSQNIGGTKAKFDKDIRESMFDKVFRKQLENPGPGYYQIPSQFGQYDGDIYKQLRTTKRSRNGWNVQSQRKYKK